MSPSERIHRTAAAGYRSASDRYERSRPLYPPDAIDLLVRELGIRSGSRVVDLGAGTGKLTRLLTPLEAEVVAVDPVVDMLRHVSSTSPEALPLAGQAERLPLRDGVGDAVTVGTAFHWFEGRRALAEIHRVLRAGGGLGLIWNNPDRSHRWVRRVWELVDEYRGATPGNRSLAWRRAFEHTDDFTELQQRKFSYRQVMTRETLMTRVASISFIAALPDDDRARLLKEVGTIVDGYLGGQEQHRALELPYCTSVFWCRRRGQAGSSGGEELR